MASIDIICEEPPASGGSEASKSDDSELSRNFLSVGMPVTFQVRAPSTSRPAANASRPTRIVWCLGPCDAHLVM